MRKNINLSRIASLALFAAAFIWGTSFVIMKDVSERLPPSFLLAVRFTIACLLLSAISWKRLQRLNKSYVFPGVLIGALLFSAYLVQTYGLIGTTPGKNAFLTASYCIITPFLFWIVSKKHPDGFHLASALVCLAGIGRGAGAVARRRAACDHRSYAVRAAFPDARRIFVPTARIAALEARLNSLKEGTENKPSELDEK
jgi:hypothetical protein